MPLNPKKVNWHMCRISNITYSLPPKKNICNKIELCVGEVPLRQWKQGNTSLSRARKRSLVIGVFFLYIFYLTCSVN